MNDEDIKKALECCGICGIEETCRECPLKNEVGCLDILNYNLLDLINRQQERIEELEIITGLANNRKCYRKFVDEVFCKQKGNELSEPDFDYIYQLYFEQQAEIERLKWEKDHFEFKVDDLNGKLEKFKEYRDIKIEADEREIEKLQSLCTSKDVIVKAQEAEIERLNSLYVSLGTDSLGNDVDVKLKYIYELESKLEAFKAEAIKEFAERLKEHFSCLSIYGGGLIKQGINNLVQEMVGGENE